MNRRILVMVAALLLVWPALPVCCAPVEGLALPKWPQSFSLTYGDHATFGIPVTQAGDISVTVQWRGQPLGIALRDMSGKTATSLAPQTAPSARLSYRVTTEDLSRGTIWVIGLTTAQGKPDIDPKTGGPVPIARGTIVASYPPVQAARFQAAFNDSQGKCTALRAKLDQQRTARIAAATRTGLKVPEAIPIPAEKGRSIRLANQLKSLRATFQAKSALTVTPGVKPNLTMLSPAIDRIVPANGYPGDSVKLYAVMATPDINANMVHFVFNQTKVLDVKPIYASDNQDGTTRFDLRLPALPTDIGPITSTKVELALDDWKGSPCTTKQVPFQLDDVPIPAITSVTPPFIGSDQSFPLVIQGPHMLPGSTVHFVLPTGNDVTVSSNLSADQTKITAAVPSYQTTDVVTLQMYLTNRDGKAGAPRDVMMYPNQHAVSWLNADAAEPGETVMIFGKGFVNPWICFKPSSYPSNTCPQGAVVGTSWKIECKTDNMILATIPDTLQGYSEAQSGDLVVYDHVKTVTVPFTLKPLMVVQPVWPAVCGWKNFCTNTLWDNYELENDSWKDSSGTYGYHWVYACHEAHFLWGYSGYDCYTTDRALLNNWTFDHAEVQDVSLDSAGSYVACAGGKSPLTNTPFVTVRWWCDAPFCIASYYATMFIRGPKGTQYAWQAQ